MNIVDKFNILGHYKNGNYNVAILKDGTKIRYNELDCFIPEYPESMDVKITNKCDMNCLMCHENSTKFGKHGDILNAKFINTIPPYTEIAIGGGNPLSHPDLIEFLEKLVERRLIPSVTVNQTHFMNNIDTIRDLVDRNLIYGLGVSMTEPTDDFINAISEFPNAVIHVINGLIPLAYLKYIAHKDLKILILGYKEFRRGKELFSARKDDICALKSDFYEALPTIINEDWFKVVSFDNLAIKQLDPKRLMSNEEWEEFYMGDDGNFTMYVDLVENKYAKSSTSELRYNLEDDIKSMFGVVRNQTDADDEVL